MRVTTADILIWTTTRQVLGRLADMLSRLEANEAARLLASLQVEIAELAAGRCNAEIWRQATADMVGPESYGLDRIGMWPKSPPSS